jgi:prepilin-type processing-associated H-X9-DG protein
MNLNRISKNPEAAFNFVELAVAVGCVGVLALLVMPAFAAGKTQSASTGCLYNLRHLQTGCAMYSTENNDYLMPNALLVANTTNTWCGGGTEGWGNSDANTNPAVYKNALLWPYLGNNLSAFRCPGDTVPSVNGYRIRSYSMNGQMGAVYSAVQAEDNAFNPGYLTYAKTSDITRPTPANAFVFADESPETIDDGWFEISSSGQSVTKVGYFPNVPACYLEGGCGFSFADGHAEIHRWQTTALFIPVQRGVTINYPFVPMGGPGNADWIWFGQHATSHQ